MTIRDMTENTNNHLANYWQKITGDKIQCLLCPRHCRLNDGQSGFCSVRQNIKGKLILTTYGLCSGLAIDPIEKKPLYHFFPGGNVLSFGTAGCNLDCSFCQNWHLSRADAKSYPGQKASPSFIAQTALKEKCIGVAFTYNEPSIFAEYAIDTAQECHKAGLQTVAVTSGYIEGAAREDFYKVMDAANVDLKSFNNDFYREFCHGDLKTVLDTLLHIKEKTKTWLEITTLLIPYLNDSPKEINELCAWVKKYLGNCVPIHFSAFHPDYKMTGINATGKEIINQAREIAHSKGLKYVYTGNIHDPSGSTTFCPNCGETLIKRAFFSVTANNLADGNKCPKCFNSGDAYLIIDKTKKR
ncbi:MAG: AmmeMemoRadiSam system radical SAM enzyme [Candidatus Omnitrophica bacterium]|nr:AmmeMemoRadiSam system radical SAM enzyme [Candidatus Omnitrophota bacterium]